MNMTKRILIVDDEPAILLSFKKLLQGPDQPVDVSETMEDAEAKIQAGNYWVVIADLRLTGVLGEEGLELIRYVKENKPDTHVILITGYGNPTIQERAIELGASGYFEKPVSAGTLKEAIAKLH